MKTCNTFLVKLLWSCILNVLILLSLVSVIVGVTDVWWNYNQLLGLMRLSVRKNLGSECFNISNTTFTGLSEFTEASLFEASKNNNAMHNFILNLRIGAVHSM